MAPRTPARPVIATGAPRRTVAASSTALATRPAQVLQSSRAPAQLSLFLRPSGAR